MPFYANHIKIFLTIEDLNKSTTYWSKVSIFQDRLSNLVVLFQNNILLLNVWKAIIHKVYLALIYFGYIFFLAVE